ncbi:Gfo/Idh/MocA family oxidoreductase [Rhodohalobacter sulfatireducens]|uniref:Gfo/Idh/MocA family oxidoreductase n=1 Tax=Rhodohalobacter sulfatireducens TaxID=2911366 RepID=A0ABS9K9I9_9BACT|nr:Gfo/Idh/MocA family oxidoreductase [Rhodohalobacter sulfatireducens]MCG2587495.1 Gfo/Idh/MocA family oxidoreductase [Rhodohalobacter sulfatireducens]
MSNKVYNILVVGCGNMGTSHARAYNRLDGFNIVGLVSRGPESRKRLSNELGGNIPTFSDFETALKETKPDAVSINTYASTHAQYSIKALESGAHVFVEKPLAETVEDAEKVVEAAEKANKKVLVGYIARHHPGWIKFVEEGKKLGKPLVMRMNLNQQSTGSEWQVHKNLMDVMSPIVDCGVHYVDMMCQMTQSDPVQVHAIGARLSEEINEDMYNYGQLQVVFEDGSVGWYESGWGPMVSEYAYFVKDVFGPKGSVSIRKNTFDQPRGKSADIEEHGIVRQLHLHSSETDQHGKLINDDEIVDIENEPGHDELCYYEQKYFLKTIQEDIDLSEHLKVAVQTLKIVLACDESVRTKKIVPIN